MNKVKVSGENNCQGTVSKTISRVYIGSELSSHQPARRDLSEHMGIPWRPWEGHVSVSGLNFLRGEIALDLSLGDGKVSKQSNLDASKLTDCQKISNPI